MSQPRAPPKAAIKTEAAENSDIKPAFYVKSEEDYFSKKEVKQEQLLDEQENTMDVEMTKVEPGKEDFHVFPLFFYLYW